MGKGETGMYDHPPPDHIEALQRFTTGHGDGMGPLVSDATLCPKVHDMSW